MVIRSTSASARSEDFDLGRGFTHKWTWQPNGRGEVLTAAKGVIHMLGREFTGRAVVSCLALAATLLAGGATSPALAAMPGAAGPFGAVPIVGGVEGGAFAGGTLALITEASSTVTFVDASTLNVRATAVLPQAPVAVAMSPDGALAYVAGKNSITVVDTTNGASLRTASYPGLGIGCNSMTMGSKAEYIKAQLVISPDGTRLSTLAVGCGRTSNVWVIDPVSLAVIGMALVYRESYGSVDYPGTILAKDSSTLVTKSSLNESANQRYYLLASIVVTPSSANVPCGEANPCWDGRNATNMPGTTLTPLDYPGTGGLGVDPESGALLAPMGQSLAVLDPGTGATTSQIPGFFGKGVLVDAAARRAYGDAESVVELSAGKALGALSGSTLPAGSSFFAFNDGRGFAGTPAGLSIVDVANASLVPTRVPKVSVKVSRVGTSKARAAISWPKPAGSGAGPITGYRVVAGGGQACNTRTTTCTLNLGKPTEGKYYTFTVTALNKSGTSAPTTTKAKATG